MNKSNYITRSARTNLVGVLTSANFAISILMIFGILFAEVIGDISSRVFSASAGFGDAYFFNISMHFGYYIYAAPLACAFASSGQFISDMEAGFFRLRMMKSGRKGYQYGLWFGTTLGGGLALMLGVLLMAISCALIFAPYYAASNMSAAQGWIPLLSRRFGNWNYMLMHALMAFLFGMVWSGVGLTFSVLSPNRYVSYFAPFIVCFCAALVLPPPLQPLEMLVQMNWETFSIPKLLAYQLALYVGIMLWFIFASNRRVVREKN